MDKKDCKRVCGLSALVFAIGLVAINIIRIFRVPITCDEAPSRSDMLMGYGDYIHLTKVTANIHILNSILRKASITLFGNTPFFLRLPNLLAQIGFLVFGYLLLGRIIKNSYWRLGALVLINLNPFLFEFWGLSRGYGLAISFMMGSIYFLILYLEEKKVLHLSLSLLFGMAAVYSNFALLNYYVALTGVLALQGWMAGSIGRFLKKEVPAIGLSGLVLFLLIVEPIKKLRESNELYYGGERGVVSDTITSLVQQSLYINGEGRHLTAYISYLIVAAIIASSVYWGWSLIIKGRYEQNIKGTALWALLVIPLLSLIAQHALMGTKFLIDRTALFIVVLFVLHLTYCLYHVEKPFTYAGRTCLVIIVLLASINFAEHITLRKSRMWWSDNYNTTVLKRILSKGPFSHPVKLRTAWMTMPSMDYYVYTKYSAQFAPLEFKRDIPAPGDTLNDYYYLRKEDMKNVESKYKEDTIFDNGFHLYERVNTGTR
jgi:hypothetical protein